MTAAERSEFVQKFLDEYVLKVLVSKGSEYSRGEVDVNSNFKRVASSMKFAQAKAAWVYAAKHWDSITNYVAKDGQVQLSEPIEGRLGDMINYLLILGSIFEEERAAASDGRQ